VASVADGLHEFGLAEMAYLVEQARARGVFLDQLEQLIRDAGTLEATMHRALESNLWVFGVEYSLFASNITLRRLVEEYVGKKYDGSKAERRPDLLLSQSLNGEYLLIEFKRPDHQLRHEDYVQAISYRHEFAKSVTAPIRVLVIGGKRSPDFPTDNREPDVGAMEFVHVISTARRQVSWLLRMDESMIT
jgi:hypothetical protein